MLTGGSAKWPLRGGVPYQISTSECYTVERIYIGGYHDGSVRIWDASLPVLSLVSVLGFEVNRVLTINCTNGFGDFSIHAVQQHNLLIH